MILYFSIYFTEVYISSCRNQLKIKKPIKMNTCRYLSKLRINQVQHTNKLHFLNR